MAKTVGGQKQCSSCKQTVDVGDHDPCPLQNAFNRAAKPDEVDASDSAMDVDSDSPSTTIGSASSLPSRASPTPSLMVPGDASSAVSTARRSPTPGGSLSGAPLVSGEEPPMASGEGALPASEENAPPASGEGALSASEEGAPPVSEERAPPVSEEGAPPVSEEGAPPESEEGAPPVSEERSPPVSEEGAPPVSEERAPPVSEEGVPLASGGGGCRGESPGVTVTPVVKDRCPVCHNEFERLFQHLRRSASCNSTLAGIAALEQFENDRLKRGRKKRVAKPRGSTGRSPPALASAARGLNGTANGSFDGNGSSTGPAPISLSPCAGCGGCFQRLSVHLSLSSCKALQEKSLGDSVLCAFCGLRVKAGHKSRFLEHAEDCVPGRNIAAAEARRQNESCPSVDGGGNGTPRSLSASSAISSGNPSNGTSLAIQPGVSQSSSAAIAAPGYKSVKRAKSNGGGAISSTAARGAGRRISPSPPPSPPRVPSAGGYGAHIDSVAPRLKRRGSGASSNGSGEGNGTRGGSSFSLDRLSSVESSSVFAEWDLDSGSESDSDSKHGKSGGGLGGGSIPGGGGILRGTRRPLPPKKRWEAEFEAWAEGTCSGEAENGLIADVYSSTPVSADDRPSNDDYAHGGGRLAEAYRDDIDGAMYKKYPRLVQRARDSRLATVREVRPYGRDGCDRREASASTGGGTEATVRELEALVDCMIIVDCMGEVRKILSASCPRNGSGGGNGKTPIPTPSDIVGNLLGLEMGTLSSSQAANDGSEFPIVAVVSKEGAAARSGVIKGSSILQVDSASMVKKTASESSKTVFNALKKKDKGKGDSTTIVFTIRTPPWRPMPAEDNSATPFARGLIAGSRMEVESVAESGDKGMLLGGMVCLAREGCRGREFIEMCWSVLLLPEGGVPAPHQCPPGHAIDQFLGERAPEQEDQVASRLGFHVERRELAGGMECIQVSSVEPGSLAARHGLRTRDLILSLDGKHLLSSSETNFWVEVGKRLLDVDFLVEKDRRATDGGVLSKANRKNPAERSSPLGEVTDNCWLRFLVFRKGTPTPSPASPPRNGVSASVANVGRGGGLRVGTSALRGRGFGQRLVTGRGGRGGRGRGMLDRNSKRPESGRVFAPKVEETIMTTSTERSSPTTTMAVSHPATTSAPVPVPAPASASISLSSSVTTPTSASAPAPAPAPASSSSTSTSTSTSTASGSAHASSPTAPSAVATESVTVTEVVKESAAGARRRVRDSKKRPSWWPSAVKGSYRTVLRLRPANALPSAMPGDPLPPGAFLVEDAHLGSVMTIPAGSKLVSVDDVLTADLPFERARAVALEAGKNSCLAFE